MTTINAEELLERIDKEMEFAKNCNMPQFVMGLIQAKTIVNELKFKANKENN